ncbi:MAG: shikimate kinase [Actinomycetaceae bacterium]|nr:shikimate kinase [Actinomycetaceae bacterium]
MDSKPQAVFIGVSGAGKTQIAHAVAQLLNQPVHESATYVGEVAGQDAELTVVRSDPKAYAAHTIAGALKALTQSGVVVLSPDAPLEKEVAEKLKALRADGVKVIELYADFNTLANRTGLNAPRSVSLGPTRRTFRLLVEAYREAYSSLADEKIDTSLTKPEFVAPRVVALLG